MKGVVFRMLEEFVIEKAGPEAWEVVLDRTPRVSTEPFVGPGTYPDADFMAFVATATSTLGVPLAPTVRAFGRFCLPRLMRAVPGLTESFRSPSELLLALEGTVHREVRKLWSDARPPRFECHEVTPGVLVMRYESQRQLCTFLEGLLEGTADWYGVPVAFEHTECTHRGDPACTFTLHVGAVEEAAEE